jgi:asparagine synthetase B (glutamine-hydrolysing)
VLWLGNPLRRPWRWRTLGVWRRRAVAQVQGLHQFDCLRANKSTSAWGVEPRVPFLDTDFMDLSMNIDPHEKMIRKVGPSLVYAVL